MNNQEKIAAVDFWQNDPLIHPLTCGNNSRHALLKAVEENGQVVMKCSDCDYVQEWIPEVVFQRYARHLSGHDELQPYRDFMRNLKAENGDNT